MVKFYNLLFTVVSLIFHNLIFYSTFFFLMEGMNNQLLHIDLSADKIIAAADQIDNQILVNNNKEIKK